MSKKKRYSEFYIYPRATSTSSGKYYIVSHWQGYVKGRDISTWTSVGARSRELEGIKVGYYTKQEEPSKGWAQAIIVERSQGLYQKMKGKKNNIRIWYKSNYCGRKTQKEKKYQLASCATWKLKNRALCLCVWFFDLVIPSHHSHSPRSIFKYDSITKISIDIFLLLGKKSRTRALLPLYSFTYWQNRPQWSMGVRMYI